MIGKENRKHSSAVGRADEDPHATRNRTCFSSKYVPSAIPSTSVDASVDRGADATARRWRPSGMGRAVEDGEEKALTDGAAQRRTKISHGCRILPRACALWQLEMLASVPARLHPNFQQKCDTTNESRSKIRHRNQSNSKRKEVRWDELVPARASLEAEEQPSSQKPNTGASSRQPDHGGGRAPTAWSRGSPTAEEVEGRPADVVTADLPAGPALPAGRPPLARWLTRPARQTSLHGCRLSRPGHWPFRAAAAPPDGCAVPRPPLVLRRPALPRLPVNPLSSPVVPPVARRALLAGRAACFLPRPTGCAVPPTALPIPLAGCPTPLSPTYRLSCPARRSSVFPAHRPA